MRTTIINHKVQKTPDSCGKVIVGVEGHSVDGFQTEQLQIVVGDHLYAKTVMEMAEAMLTAVRAGIPFCVDFRCERGAEINVPLSMSAVFELSVVRQPLSPPDATPT